jgi:hypothetical protein
VTVRRRSRSLDFDHESVLILLDELARGAGDLFDERRELHGLRIELALAYPVAMKNSTYKTPLPTLAIRVGHRDGY